MDHWFWIKLRLTIQTNISSDHYVAKLWPIKSDRASTTPPPPLLFLLLLYCTHFPFFEKGWKFSGRKLAIINSFITGDNTDKPLVHSKQNYITQGVYWVLYFFLLLEYIPDPGPSYRLMECIRHFPRCLCLYAGPFDGKNTIFN